MDTNTPKLIIVEGQDRCGKSTFLKNLRKSIQNPKVITLATSSPPNVPNREEWNVTNIRETILLVNRLLGEGWTVLIDRFHIGETVYGPIFRNSDTEYVWDFDELLSFNDHTWLITLVDTPENLISRDDGLSNEKTSADYLKVREGFIISSVRSKIRNKFIHDVSTMGWIDTNIVLELVYA